MDKIPDVNVMQLSVFKRLWQQCLIPLERLWRILMQIGPHDKIWRHYHQEVRGNNS